MKGQFVMSDKRSLTSMVLVSAALLALGMMAATAVAQDTATDHVAAIKKSLAASQGVLKNYQ